MKYIMKMTKGVYQCYVDPNGNLYDRPVGFIGRRGLDKKHDDFLKKYINLIMNTKIVSGTTKIYIRSALNSVKSVFDEYNLGLCDNEKLNIKTVQSKVDYDIRKLLKYFSDTMLNNVIGSSSCDMENYNKRLNLAIAAYSKKNKMLDNLALKISQTFVNDYMSDEDFDEFLKIIAPYTKCQMKYIEENLPHEGVGYINYLCSASHLTGKAAEHYQRLRDLLE